ncbi:hypothetical protein MPC1_15460001 [Methylocella tundrae]|nr:hypothetical protein MPC1_15460001 [Methylocella tundrae]
MFAKGKRLIVAMAKVASSIATQRCPS